MLFFKQAFYYNLQKNKSILDNNILLVWYASQGKGIFIFCEIINPRFIKV